MENDIPLSDILSIADKTKYKVHLATADGSDSPLDVFVRDWNEWVGWNSWRGSRDEFSREYILALIDFRFEPNTWLFGGVFRVLSRGNVNRSRSYEVECTDQFSNLIGRLKLGFRRPGRTRAVNLERYSDQITIVEVLRERFTGEAFCGYEQINHDFVTIESIIQNAKPDWKAALEHVKGVYLITDKSNGKRYVGSAYGGTGVWSRWSCYACTGHGYNDELTKLIANDRDYARKNFVFALLEYRPMKTDDIEIIGREKYWKEVLLTRGPYGYNKN